MGGCYINKKFGYKNSNKILLIFSYNVMHQILKFDKKRSEIKSILRCHVP